MLSVVTADGATESSSLIDEVVREGARRVPPAALEAEANQGVAELAAEADERGCRLMVRSSHHGARAVVIAAGPVEVTGSPAAALVMMVELVESAQARGRAITGAHLVPMVRAGARFESGLLVEREEQAA